MTMATHSMSLVQPAARRSWTLVERNFWKGAALTAALVLAFQVIYWVERNGFGIAYASRFVANASETAMRYFTIPHIIIGFLFSVTAVRNRTTARRMLISMLLLVGAGLCGLYWRFNGYTDPLAAVLVYTYFLVHEMRDEAFFYTLLGDSPPIDDKPRFTRLVWGSMALAIVGLGVLAWPGIVFHWFHKAPWALSPDLSLGAKVALTLAPLATWLAAGYLFLLVQARAGYHTVGNLVRAHAPMFRLFGGVLLVLGMAMLVAERPYSLILLHVSVWYVFTCHMLRNRPPAPPSRGWWTWMRTTMLGFRVLHIGMALLLIAVGVVRTYGFNQHGWLWYLLSRESFLYWTIMHITVSFVPR